MHSSNTLEKTLEVSLPTVAVIPGKEVLLIEHG